MLFQFDVSRPPIEALTTLYWSSFGEEAGDVPREYADRLALGAAAHLNEIDDHIRRRAEHWRISRMAVVDRNILRLAIYEFLYESETPKTVVINEALEIARRFSTFEATQFINGILDAVKRDLEDNEEASSVASSQKS
jgi:N utilization substance protein B